MCHGIEDAGGSLRESYFRWKLGVRQNIPHRGSRGWHSADRNGVKASQKKHGSREFGSMGARIVQFGVRLILTEPGKYSKLLHAVKRFSVRVYNALPALFLSLANGVYE